MKLSDEQIQKLLEWFVNLSETNKNLSQNRKKSQEENHKWLQPDVIENISDENLETKFLEYFNAGGGRQHLYAIYRDRIIRDKKRFREVILFLLNENVDIKSRLDEILSGTYRIEGFGKAILTSFLMDFKPDKYCLWNHKSEMGFSVLGWQVYENKDSRGVAYLKVLEALQKLRDLKPEFNLTFGDVDLFLHTISAEEEGSRAISSITEGKEFFEPTTKNIEQISAPVENMEFAMEKYLEEFIETNFNKIFGATLKVFYEKEENIGRQYPTSIGNIDLLAIDEDKKEFIVIELKKGRSSDVVIGQILRYMGWVKENLAKDEYAVRGIIIVKDKDDKLEYALKLLPSVSLFFYNVSFELKGAI
ncbi:DUF1016 family protein [Candidatus Woesearchaeota archaeon]|nr:DUF1016 family protein [Candidatus Woesearchaeota archaeon]